MYDDAVAKIVKILLQGPINEYIDWKRDGILSMFASSNTLSPLEDSAKDMASSQLTPQAPNQPKRRSERAKSLTAKLKKHGITLDKRKGTN
jgi:hypothetical protein